MGEASRLRTPCGVTVTFPAHFSVVDDAIGPQPWMQLRLVKSATAESVSKNYDPNDGRAKNDLLQLVSTTWTNNSPVTQYVYGMVSKSGSQVSLQCRSRGYLQTNHGVTVGAAGASVIVSEASRFGVGSDLGNGGLLLSGIAQEFGVSEYRQNSTTIPLMPNLTGWFVVAPGESFNTTVEVRFISEFWENVSIGGGDADTESKVITGDVRVDVFALPAVVAPAPRSNPTIVGGTSNVKSAVSNDWPTSVTTPSSLATGDILMAIVANQYGLPATAAPEQAGWTLLHGRSDTDFLGLLNGSNLRVYIRTVSGSMAGSYSFTNNAGSQQIAVLMGLRDSVPHDAAEGLNWQVGSSLNGYSLFDRFKAQAAPSLSRSGQMLLAVSYFGHEGFQYPVTQTAPAGMTKIADVTASGSTMALAYMTSPPNPTLDRVFTPNKIPIFGGYALSASILIPGARQL